MAEKQKLFWISKKSVYGKGLLKFGDPIEGIIPEELYSRFKKSGEIGAIEVAKAENVSVETTEKLDIYKLAVVDVVKLLSQSSISKPEKEAMIKTLEGLDND